MSLLIRAKRSTVPAISSVTVPTSKPRPSTAEEAPDWGRRGDEAPESRTTRHREAPDAGEGRASYFEHEFTRGRSQS
jgi:hypothetical protein